MLILSQGSGPNFLPEAHLQLPMQQIRVAMDKFVKQKHLYERPSYKSSPDRENDGERETVQVCGKPKAPPLHQTHSAPPPACRTQSPFPTAQHLPKPATTIKNCFLPPLYSQLPSLMLPRHHGGQYTCFVANYTPISHCLK